MPRACTACAHPDRDALDRALVRGEPKRQIAASLGLAESALGRHARAHLPKMLVAAEQARASANADLLLGELAALQGKALELLARAEADGDLRGAIVALKEARECVALRARLGAELREDEARKPGTFAALAKLATVRVEYVQPRESLGEKLDALATRLGPSSPGATGRANGND